MATNKTIGVSFTFCCTRFLQILTSQFVELARNHDFFSLLPCASSANNLAYCESAEDLGFYLETFGINIDDTGV